MGNYTIYHLHSDQSNGTTNIDSVTKYGDYIKAAQKCGMSAMGFSEHGNIFEWVHKKEAIEAAGMKYIHAIEAYLTEDLVGEDGNPMADNYHCVLIAKNYDGVKELNKLSSNSYNRNDGHYYYKPRILFDELFATSDNILITSACLGGCFHNGTPSAKERMLNFFRRNAHRCYFEIQHHNCQEQIDYNKLLYKLSTEIGVPLIAGTDTHALNDWHMKGRSLLQKSKGVSFDGENDWDLTFKSYEDLIEAYKVQGSLPMEVIQEAVENTNRMADRIESFKLDSSPKYPKLYSNSKEVFRKKIRKGIEWRGIDKLPNYQEYLDRIEYEIGVYEHNDAVDFMLLEEDYKSEMRRRNIRFGYSRGSVSGSIVAYILGITEMDSVKYNLNFERFMNVERVSLADIDTDWYSGDRDEVKKYLHQKEGLYCCDIVTFNTIVLRGAIKAICKGMHIANMEMLPDSLKGEINKSKAKNKGEESYSPELAKRIEQEYKKRAQFKEVSLEYLKVADTVIELAEQDEEKARAKYQTIFEYVDLVSGVIVSVGNHPAGCVVSPFPVDEWFGTFTTKDNEYPISVLNMKEIDSLNFVKLDLLCIDNLGLIYKTCDAVGLPYLTPDNTPPDDEAVWKSIRDDTTMIFQWESQRASAYLKQLLSDTTIKKIRQKNPDASYMDLLSIGNGAIRPAGESYRNQLAAGEYKLYGSKELDEFMAPTLGYCIEENQLVNTTHGRVPIKDVEVGDSVYTANGVSVVEHKICTGVKQTIKVSTQTSEIICTKDHLILTDDGWKQAGDIKTGDVLAYRVGNTNTATHPRNKLRTIGYLLGDGMLTRRNNVAFVNQSKEVAEDFSKCICEFEGCDTHFVERKTLKGKSLYYVYAKHIAQKKKMTPVAEYLKSLGLKWKNGGCDAHTKFIPSFVFGLKRDCILELLGAYTDTDCCVKNKGKIVVAYKTSSEKLAEGLIELLRLIGYTSAKYTDKKTGGIAICVNNAKSLLMELYQYSFKVRRAYKPDDFRSYCRPAGDTLIKNASFQEQSSKILSKSNVSKKWVVKQCGVNLYSNVKYRSVDGFRAICSLLNEDSLYFGNESLKWIKVRDIQDCGERQVFDLTIKGEHNFVCNGIVVHNCVYQEQIIEFLYKFCGFTMGEADVVRRHFSKKQGTDKDIPIIKDGGYLTNSKDHYIKGFIQTMQDDYGVLREEAENLIGDFLQVIIDASDYLFSKNHSDPYSWIGYICGYLRYYYPVEFITTALNIFETDNKKSAAIIEYAKKQGVQILPIKFRHSGAKYTADTENHAIYKGIASIKYMNNEIADRLMEFKDTPIKTFSDLLFLIKGNSIPINARQFKGLIFLDFFSEFGEPNKLWAQYELFDKFYGKKQIKKEALTALGFPLEICGGITEKETAKMFSGVDINEMLNRAIPYVRYNKSTLKQRIAIENEYLGYIDVHDSRYSGYAVVLEVNTKYSPRVKMYALKSGGVYDCKINKKLFNKLKLNNGDIIRISKQSKKPKYKMGENKKFVPIAGEREIWIDEYEIVNDIAARNA